MAHTSTNQYLSRRPMVLGLAKVLVLAITQLPFVRAAPFRADHLVWARAEGGEEGPKGTTLWIYLGVAAALVLLGGAFAGLTIALMGQDEIYLQVIQDSGEGAEKVHARKVLNLLNRGKHWVLVTLLLSNVITNETLPIVLDRSLGGGWPAVLGSTVLIVIFGEIVPQSICVRFGLPIGAWCAPAVLVLMYVMAVVAWPTAKLLDYLLGEDHGTVYKKAGLKTLVSLHRSLGEAGQRLHADEVTIISAVLDLKEKSVGSIMTPMDDVFTLSLDDILDEDTMDDILSQGYSRIPVHHPENAQDFVGMLLVKMLITYDPEDAKPVREFALATLPETRPDTSCLDIVNFFQEGKSHMVLVSERPGSDNGALGVVTLEDVIEELIGEEIIDESDVFVDVHKAIRRIAPAPRARVPKVQITTSTPKGSNAELINIAEGEALDPKDLQRIITFDEGTKRSPGPPGRRSSTHSSNAGDPRSSRRSQIAEFKEHLDHLKPSNLASRPKTTRYASVKIKPGQESNTDLGPYATSTERIAPTRRISESATDFAGGIGEGLLKSGGKVASDGVHALASGYGAISTSPSSDRRPTSANKGIQADLNDGNDSTPRATHQNSRPTLPTVDSDDTVGELPSRTTSKSPFFTSGAPARSGSITENIVDANGIRKVVLETTSSSDSTDEEQNIKSSGQNEHSSHEGSYEDSSTIAKLRGGGNDRDDEHSDRDGGSSKKKKRKKKSNNKKGKGETQPLLGDRE